MASTAGEPSIREPTAGHRIPGPLVLLGGLLGGLAWGVIARVWMRFISTDPEFTWSGTLFIVVGFGIAGLAQSGAYLGRRARPRRRPMTALRVVTFACLLPLGLAAGGPVFPTVVLAPLALTHTEWSSRTRLFVGVIALLPVATTTASLFDDLSGLRALAVSCGSSPSTRASSGPPGPRLLPSPTGGGHPGWHGSAVWPP